MLLDAPCSSTGTIRRHPDIPWLKSEADLAPLSALQARLLDRAAALLKPGGTLVYCTCSLEPEEGEQADRRPSRPQPRPPAPPRSRPTEIGGLTELISPEGDLRSLPCHLPDPDPQWAVSMAFSPRGWSGATDHCRERAGWPPAVASLYVADPDAG